MKKPMIIPVLLAVTFLLCACQLRTVDQMYRVPKRPQSYDDLQTVMDKAMGSLEYSAPRAGEHQQTVQMADLDGDGIREYLLYAKGDGDKPLQILIFAQRDACYELLDTIGCAGASFDVVEYVQMDGVGGMEIVVGCRISQQVPRSVGVYTLKDGAVQQVLSTNYTKFLTCDLDSDTLTELMVLRPGDSDTDNGAAQLYEMEKDTVLCSNESILSCPARQLKRVITGKLHKGVPAVFAASAVDENTIITDVYTVLDGVFTNITLSKETGTSAQTLRNGFVYADDIDEDGEVELPSVIIMGSEQQASGEGEQHLIRWYSIGTDGAQTDKMHTFHNFAGGWFLKLDPVWAQRIRVKQEGNAFSFYLWNDGYQQSQKIFSIFMLTAQDREEQAVMDNRFVIYKNESVIYAARLEVASGALRITQDDLIKSFRLIRQDWKTGEM